MYINGLALCGSRNKVLAAKERERRSVSWVLFLLTLVPLSVYRTFFYPHSERALFPDENRGQSSDARFWLGVFITDCGWGEETRLWALMSTLEHFSS